MRAYYLTTFIFLLTLFSLNAFSQNKLNPGFDPNEFIELLKLSEQHYDSAKLKYASVVPDGYKRECRSEECGMYNRYDFWIKNNDETGIIVLRGTVGKSASWLENFYMPMIPSTGEIQIEKDKIFKYKVAADEKAYVHLGWMIGIAHLAPSIIDNINLAYKKGVRHFIIMGHSQGGALAFLLRSYLQYLDEGIIPKDIQFKTYCAAPPKPGNLYYSYDFDYINRGGWAFRVVNPLDWVPESPFTVQTINDANTISPLRHKDAAIKHAGFATRIYMKRVYRKLNKATLKTMKGYQKYLGKRMYLLVKQNLKDYKEPKYAPSMNYSTAGTPIILNPTAAYHEKFKPDLNNDFMHHSFKSYIFLTQENYLK